jgi:fatty acid desaturase
MAAFLKTTVGQVRDAIFVTVAVIYTTSFLLFWRFVGVAGGIISLPLRRVQIRGICRRSPAMVTLAATIVALILSAWLQSMVEARAWPSAFAALFAMVASLRVLTVASFFLNMSPKTLEQIEQAARCRWPERWFYRQLRTPIDAYFIRYVINNSLQMIPVWIVIAIPDLFSIPSYLVFWVAWNGLGISHETLDHTNMHNYVFRARKDASVAARSIASTVDFYLDYVLNPLCLRIPNYYRAIHVYMHHVEDNGPHDIHGTLPYDRASYFAFSRACLTKGWSLIAPVDIYLYLGGRKKRRQQRLVLLGYLYWLGTIGLLALVNWPGALLVAALRFYSGVYHVTNNFSWHGFVDLKNPGNLALNSINVYGLNTHGELGAAAHIEHHLYPGMHWSKLYAIAKENQSGHLQQDAVLLWSDWSMGFNLLCALWTRRFDLIGNYVMSRGPSGEKEFHQMIWDRTRPQYQTERFRFADRLDELCGKIVARMLLGRLPGVEEAHQIAQNRFAALERAAA